MELLRRLLIAFCASALLANGAVHSASRTNYSDQWWAQNESGWGAAVMHEANILFVNIVVYASDGKATWFTGAAPEAPSAPGHTVFAGDLYATTGPWYGTTFNPTNVIGRKVGTITFDATGWNQATLLYSVDGVPVSKNITRQTWAADNLTGKYWGVWHFECSNGAFPTTDEWIALEITHTTANSISILVENPPLPSFGYLLFVGTFVPVGQMGQINVTLQPTDHGTVTFTEVQKTEAGFIGRFTGTINSCVVANGRIAAVAR